MRDIQGNILDIYTGKWIRGALRFNAGGIVSVREKEHTEDVCIIPGLIDAHIHIESSMLTPSQFARIAVTHGTIATVSDPHEIANVCGIEGVRYMQQDAKDAGMKFYFGAPSCVPATSFETAGAVIDIEHLEQLLSDPEILYLSEMMNYPGVLNQDTLVMQKLDLAKKYNKPIDGHAPGLKGDEAAAYISSGISTDHECYTLEEALDKIRYGMKIIIREGSAARNFEALHSLISSHPDKVMLCSDDKHPDELLHGHINKLLARAVEKGHDPITVLRCATLNPFRHYRLNVGMLQPGDPADFIVVDNLKDFKVQQTWVNGDLKFDKGTVCIPRRESTIINQFKCDLKNPSDFIYKSDTTSIHVIGAVDGQLITHARKFKIPIKDNIVESDISRDIIKIAVINRYNDSVPAISFIQGIGLTSGAIASSVAHDSHNIVVAGVDDESIAKAVNLVINKSGGLSAVNGEREEVLPLPVGGLMTTDDCQTTSDAYLKLDKMAKEMGSNLRAPYMTLSFMALLVIPELKLSDLGLFDGKRFEFV